MVNLKVKLHRDRESMEEIEEQCKEKIIEIENNSQILEKMN